MHTQYGPGDSATWGQIHSTADPRYQEDDDAIEAIAAEEMARLCDAAGEIRPGVFAATADELLDLMDETELQALAAATVTGPLAVRQLMEPKVRDFLEAKCLRKAGAWVIAELQRAEDEAAADRMAH